MKKLDKQLLLFNILSFFVIFILFLLKTNTYIRSISLSFSIILFFISYLLFGFRRDRGSTTKVKLLLQFIICLLLYLIIVYTFGIKVSYSKNLYTLAKIEDVIYIALGILFHELYRYTLINRNINDTKQRILVFIYFVLIETLIVNNYCYINTPLLIVILSIEKNILLNRSTKYGYKSNLVYLLILELLPNILTYPSLSPYLYVTLITVLNTILLLFTLKLNRIKDKEVVNNVKKSILLAVEGVLCLLVLITIVLVSGLFKYNLSSIASNSMYPAIKKGDAIIVRKLTEEEKENLKVGDIIAFNEDDFIITHRIIDIKDGIFITKGDNNNIEDTNRREKNDIVGIIVTRIPYIGYPSVFISEMLNE